MWPNARAVDLEAGESDSRLGRDAQHTVILGISLHLPVPNKMNVSICNATAAHVTRSDTRYLVVMFALYNTPPKINYY